jgi:hypothetical protein
MSRSSSIAALANRNAHRGEEAGHHDLISAVRLVPGRRHRLAVDEIIRPEIVAADRQRDRGSGRLDARQRLEPLLQRSVEADLLGLIFRRAPRQVQRERQQVARIDAGVHPGERHEAAHEQRGPRHEQQRDGDLARHQPIACAPAAP